MVDEVFWWFGDILVFKLYGICDDGRMIICNSFVLGIFIINFLFSDYGNVGVMGDKYFVFGDIVIGLLYKKIGVFDLVGGGYFVVFIIFDSFCSICKGIFGCFED